MNSNIATRCAHIVIATLVTGLTVTANHAWAAAPYEAAKSVVVRYADLDLSRPKDARTLYDRLHVAARLACDNIGVWHNDMDAFSQYHRCVQRAMANAVASSGSERLTEIYSRERK
jgi:UrcA family protein